MAKKKTHTRLYEVMGVSTEVTPEELKKAYRRKALLLHPDKRGQTPEAQEDFMNMKYAYDVLSDPKKKEVYDMMGEDGLKMVDQFGDLSPDELTSMMFRSLIASGPQGKCMMLSVVMVFFAFFLLIPSKLYCQTQTKY